MWTPKKTKEVLDHEAEIPLHEIIDMRSHNIEVGVGNAEPPGQRRSKLVGRGRRNHAATAHIIVTTYLQERIVTVDVTSFDSPAKYELIATPRVIATIAVGRQRPAEIRLGERCYAFRNADSDSRSLKRRQRFADIPQQPRLILVLVIV